MEPFLISEKRLAEMTATRQGRISLAGFNFQASYAVTRLASMLVRHPVLDLPDFPIRLRYDWGEDLDEQCDNGRIVFTQCKKIDNIGQPAQLSSVLQSFAAKWLFTPTAQRNNVYFRLVCTDARFRAGGQLSNFTDDSHNDTSRHFVAALGIKPGDKSDRAMWQADADDFGYAQLFSSLWERTDVVFLPPDAINGLPASPLLHAEREALEALLTFSKIDLSKQAEALARLRRIVHDNLIRFDPTNEAVVDFSQQKPRIRERADVANALASCQPLAGGSLPFDVVDRTFLSKQRESERRQFVARQPDWADVVHGADETIKFVERSVTSETRTRVVTELVEPIERETERRLHMLFIVGAPGSGKTTLVRRVAAMLVDEGRIVVADAGVDAREPAGTPEDYAVPLEQLANAGRPVIFLLDDPLYGDSPWIPVLKRLNRPGLKVAVLAPCPQMLFDRHKGSVPIGVIKHFSIGAPTDTERAEMRRLYGRTTDTLMRADEFLVITMEAAAGISFDEIIQRLWLTLNDGKTIPEDWESAAWSLRAFLVVCYFHRFYLGCPEPVLRSVLGHRSGGGPEGDISTALARLHAQDGWLMFRFAEHEFANFAYQGTQVFTAHQRIAQRAWELRPMGWWNIGDKIVQASLAAPQSIRQVGALAARLCVSENETDQAFVMHLVDEWCSVANQQKIPTRYFCDFSTALQVNGQRGIAHKLEDQLRSRSTNLGDGWLAALRLAYLAGDSVDVQSYPTDLNIKAVIAHSDFSIAPNRATQFFSRLPSGTKPVFIKRILDAFDGSLQWRLESFLIVWLFRNGPEEMLKRSTQIEAWLKAHPDDTDARSGYLGMLSKQGVPKAMLDRVIADTETWLKAHPDDRHVRNVYLSLLSRQWLSKIQLDRAISDTEAWLKAHPDDRHVHNGYLGLLSRQGVNKVPIQLSIELPEPIKIGVERVLTEAWKAVPADIVGESRFKTARHAALQSISRLSPKIKREVGAHFETQKWELLKTRDPEP